MNNSNENNPRKKHRANDGRLFAMDCANDVNAGNTNDSGGFSPSFSERGDDSTEASPKNNKTQLDRMEEMMMRMEEKLAAVSSLENRCHQLEAKCISLETMLELTSQSTKKHVDEKFDSLYLHLERKSSSLVDKLDAKVDEVHKQVERSLKLHEYNAMLIKNQSWEYSAALSSVVDLVYDGYTDDEAEYLAETAEELKDMTTSMRRGEWPLGSHLHEMNGNLKGIFMEMSDSDRPFSYEVNTELLPHWKEFVAALKQFAPAINLLPDNCESYFSFYFVQLNHDAMYLVYEALMGMPFNRLEFTNNTNGDGTRGEVSVDAILEIVERNKHLRVLEIGNNQIGNQHIERLCSAVRNNSLVELDLSGSFEPGIGDEMLTALLIIGELTLERLGMSSNNITSAVSTVMAEFLATNTRLKELNLSDNSFNDSDAELIANALRSNSTLRVLRLFNNNTTDAGEEYFRPVMCDESSLNSVADSNHSCRLPGFISSLCYNPSSDMGENRGRKLYGLLRARNKTMSNVQHFSDIDVKLLPNILQAVQNYSDNMHGYKKANPLSIVYEVMRRWDKVTPLYKTLGKSVR